MDEATRWDRALRGTGIYLGLVPPPDGAWRSRSARASTIGPDTRRSDLIVAIIWSVVGVSVGTAGVLLWPSFWRLLAAITLVVLAAGLARNLRNLRRFGR
jgi:hypothetical protein